VLGDFAPGLTLLFDVPVALGLERAGKRAGADSRYESMGRGFHERVREGFLAIAKAEPERVVVMDTIPSFAAVEEAVHGALASRYPELA